MLRLVFLALLLSVVSIVSAQNWVWSQHLGGAISNHPPSTIVANAFTSTGELVVSGYNTTEFDCADTVGGFYSRHDFSGNCNLYQIVSGQPKDVQVDYQDNLLLISNDNEGMVLAKYNTSNQLVWQTSIAEAYANGLAVDTEGNSFVIATLDSGCAIAPCLNPVSGEYSAILKFNSNGDCLSADTVTERVIYNSVCTDSAGNAYVTGAFSETVSLGMFNLTSVGGSDVLVAKFNSAGNCVWAKRGGGPAPNFPNQFTTEQGNDIAFNHSDGLYVTGVASDSADFGNELLTGSGSSNLLLVKYDLDGNELWAKNYFGGPDQMGLSVTSDLFGNVFLTSAFVWNINLDGIQIDGYNHFDVLVSRHDSNGNATWVQKAGSTVWNDYATDISVQNGSIAVSGKCERDAIFGLDTLFSSGLQNFVALISDQTSITDEARAQGAVVYPNPTTGLIMLKNPTLQEMEVRILNTLGEQVSQVYSLENPIRLDLSEHPSGIYFIQLVNTNGTVLPTQKLILQKH